MACLKCGDFTTARNKFKHCFQVKRERERERERDGLEARLERNSFTVLAAVKLLISLPPTYLQSGNIFTEYHFLSCLR